MSVIDPSTSLGTTLPEELKITLEDELSLPLDSIEDDDSSELDDTTLLLLANDEDDFAELEDSTLELEMTEDSSPEIPLLLSSPQAVKTRPVKRTALAQAKKDFIFNTGNSFN